VWSTKRRPHARKGRQRLAGGRSSATWRRSPPRLRVTDAAPPSVTGCVSSVRRPATFAAAPTHLPTRTRCRSTCSLSLLRRAAGGGGLPYAMLGAAVDDDAGWHRSRVLLRARLPGRAHAASTFNISCSVAVMRRHAWTLDALRCAAGASHVPWTGLGVRHARSYRGSGRSTVSNCALHGPRSLVSPTGARCRSVTAGAAATDGAGAPHPNLSRPTRLAPCGHGAWRDCCSTAGRASRPARATAASRRRARTSGQLHSGCRQARGAPPRGGACFTLKVFVWDWGFMS